MLGEMTIDKIRNMTPTKVVCAACRESEQHISEFTAEELYEMSCASESLAQACDSEIEQRGLTVIYRKNETGEGMHVVFEPIKPETT